MADTENAKLALRVQVQMDFADMAGNELRRIKKYLKQEGQPLNPTRYNNLVRALDLLQADR